MDLGRRVRKQRIFFYAANGSQRALLRAFSHPIQCVLFSFVIVRFFFSYQRFQRRSEYISQRDAIEGDAFLQYLYTTPANEVIKRYCIEAFVIASIEPIARCILRSSLEEQNGFNVLLVALGSIVSLREFSFDKAKAIASFEQHIRYDSVISLEKAGEQYELRTKNGETYRAENVVLATPLAVSAQLLHTPFPKKGKTVYAFHVRGELHDRYKAGDLKFFEKSESVGGIISQADGTHMIYSVTNTPSFDDYFRHFEVIASVEWAPMYPDIGTELIEQQRDRRLWMAGDFNVVGMEDAYISGLYAANAILV